MYKSENKIFMSNIDAQPIEKIPAGNWRVMVRDTQQGPEYYLESTDAFVMPDKIYGDCEVLASRYLKSYNHYDSNLGVLLSGLKGTGKSLLAKKICMESGMPVLIIPSPYGGPTFVSFLASIQQEVVIFIDEFEKVYDEREHQYRLLSILDGAFTSKFMFLLTINEIGKMVSYLMNRPSRIRYVREYVGLKDDMIRDICTDLLNDQSKIDDVLAVCTYLGEISMDTLVCLIEDTNLYVDENPQQIVQYMNLKPTPVNWSVTVKRKDKIMCENHHTEAFIPNGIIRVNWHGVDVEHWDALEGKTKVSKEDHKWNEFRLDTNDVDKDFKIKIGDGEIDIIWNQVSELTDDETGEESVGKATWYFTYKKTPIFNRNFLV